MSQWSDDQEIALLKAVVKWKPAGMHKHFRMIAIRDYMVGQGVVNPEDEHTKIPGIWEKLGTLYDLPVLDEREDSLINDGADEDGKPIEYYSSFDLPLAQFQELMFERRLAPDGEGSDTSPELQMSRRESTIADTDEPRSSPIPGRASGRNARAAARRGRVSQLQNEIENGRRASKASSVAEDEVMADAEDEEEQESEDSPEEDSDQEEEKRTPGPGRRGGRGSKRGVGSRGGRKRGRRA